MKRLASLIFAAAVLAALPIAALAQNPGAGPNPYGYGAMGPYGYGMGPGMMGGYGQPGYWQPAPATPQSHLTDEQAKGLAQQYADKYLKGFAVDKVLPFGTPGGTAYSVELRGPKDEIRVLHVDPWGNVMPLGGPWRNAG